MIDELKRLRRGAMAAYTASGALVGTKDEWKLDNWLALAEGRNEPHPEWELPERVCAWCGREIEVTFSRTKTHPGNCRRQYRRRMEEIRRDAARPARRRRALRLALK